MSSGEILRRARAMRGLSQRDLGSQVGAAQSVIARYESGKVEPSLDQLQRLLERAGFRLRVTIEPIRPRSHELHARRSLAYHRLVADRLPEDPALLDRGRRRVEEWASGRRQFGGSQQYVDAWKRLLTQSLPAIIDAITSDGDDARELRQNSPFNGMLGQEAWQRIVDGIKEDASPMGR